MSAALIAWLITLGFWIIFIVIAIVAVNHENYTGALIGITLQWVCVGFMWIFLGLQHNWW